MLDRDTKKTENMIIIKVSKAGNSLSFKGNKSNTEGRIGDY